MELSDHSYRAPLTANMAREITAKAGVSEIRTIATNETLFRAFEKIRRASNRGDRYVQVLAPDFVSISRGITTLTDADKKYVMGQIQSTLSGHYYDFNVEVNNFYDRLTVNW